MKHIDEEYLNKISSKIFNNFESKVDLYENRLNDYTGMPRKYSQGTVKRSIISGFLKIVSPVIFVVAIFCLSMFIGIAITSDDQKLETKQEVQQTPPLNQERGNNEFKQL